MVAMETGHFLKMLNDGSTRSIDVEGPGMHNLQKKHCGYSRERLTPSAARLFANDVVVLVVLCDKHARRNVHGVLHTLR